MEETSSGRQPARYRPNAAQWSLAGVILAFVAGLVLDKVLKGAGLDQTAAFYLGIPTVLALILTLSAPSGRAIGMTVKAITILLLLAIPVLGEGFVCVFIAAPLFYGVGIFVAWLVERLRGSGGRRAGIIVVPALALLLSTEGTAPALSFPGDNTVTAHRTVAVSADKVAAALGRPLRFADVAPTGVLAAGFPRPRADTGGLGVGDLRTITFDGAHHRPPLLVAHHWGEHTSTLQLRVAQRGPDSVTLTAVADHSPLSTWLTWQSAEIGWRAVDAGHTELTWTLHYTRRLAPAWYFSPIERLVADRAAAYLLDTVDLR